MIEVHSFTFNPMQENTYVLSDQSGECLIIDPGCYNSDEQEELAEYISNKKLSPVRLLNTHCHLDHIFGNGFVATKYQLKPEFHKLDMPVFSAYMTSAQLYGMKAEPSPPPGNFLEEGDKIKFGNSELEVFFTPGHSPGSISFYSRDDKFFIAGDVLFFGSVGRTDLPGGDHQTLIRSIKEKLFSLGDEFTVYSGHGPSTNIGYERNSNPFL